jgi:nicotinate-nucleotide adenylyltransferase
MGQTSDTNFSKIGFFGGSFDPIHLGHLSLAKQAIQSANLDSLLLCPAYHAPLRAEKPFFSTEIRLKILEQIARDTPQIKVCKLEIEKRMTCFTYNTLKEVQSQHPQSEIIVLLGADQFENLSNWKSNQELVQICKFLVFSRTKTEIIPPDIPELSFQLMQNELLDYSSTKIRNRIKSRQPVKHMLPRAAHKFIHQ